MLKLLVNLIITRYKKCGNFFNNSPSEKEGDKAVSFSKQRQLLHKKFLLNWHM